MTLVKGLLSDEKPEKKLKSLGSWLGQITILRNKPINYIDIDLKGLLCDAVEKRKVGTVVGFVCKVLEACGSSSVFTHKNPWINSLLSVLCELNER